MLTSIQTLIESLNSTQIRYCHWKSNFYLEDALAGIGDLDLLVAREDVQRFESIVASLGFKRAVDPLQTPCPSIWHFYGLDEETGILVHLHVYSRLITGESLVKNYAFPLEAVFLSGSFRKQGVPIPPKAAELLFFVLRMTVKHGSLPEYLLLLRSGENLKAELKDLLNDQTLQGSIDLLKDWLPTIEGSLFTECLNCLQNPSSFLRHFSLATRLRKQLRPLNRFSQISEWLLRSQLFSVRVFYKLFRRGKSKFLFSGGAVIALIGAEATGKSTLVKATTSWLGKTFSIHSTHLGKPPATWISALPNLALPLLKPLANQHRPSQVENEPNSEKKRVSILYAVRAVLVAWDRYQLSLRIRRQAVNGHLIICDRYPSQTVGAMDSARLNLSIPHPSGFKDKILIALANLESRIYTKIPYPDAVIHLSVPLEVALERNRNRTKEEDENYVIRRHTSAIAPSFPRSKTFELNTAQSQEDNLRAIQKFLWSIL